MQLYIYIYRSKKYVWLTLHSTVTEDLGLFTKIRKMYGLRFNTWRHTQTPWEGAPGGLRLTLTPQLCTEPEGQWAPSPLLPAGCAGWCAEAGPVSPSPTASYAHTAREGWQGPGRSFRRLAQLCRSLLLSVSLVYDRCWAWPPPKESNQSCLRHTRAHTKIASQLCICISSTKQGMRPQRRSHPHDTFYQHTVLEYLI